jgi:hypothetical protein
MKKVNFGVEIIIYKMKVALLEINHKKRVSNDEIPGYNK